jgi:LPXTG-site transpeptidase (sortase) family protein
MHYDSVGNYEIMSLRKRRRIWWGLFAAILIVVVFNISILPASAGGFFEVGQVTLTDTIDNGLWVTVNMTETFVNPVVIAGPLTHSNDLSLSIRVRNITSSSFQIGMQSPCEDAGSAAPGVICPPIAGWNPEVVNYWVVEEGAWIFPNGTEIEADRHNTSTVRANFGGSANNSDLMSYAHTYPAAPIVFHQTNTSNDSNWINTTVWGPVGGRANPPSTTGFRLALEGAEVTSSHGAEDIGWVAMQSGAGTNAGYAYDVGRTPGLSVDRHADGCYSIGSFGFAAIPNAVGNHNSMNGGNGGWLRLCGSGIETNRINVHIDEDQVRDSERTGIPEYGTWFAYDSGGFGALDFLSSTMTVTDDNGGQVIPGDTLTYTIVITNLLNDFAQADNATPEFTDPIPANTSYSPGSETASSGAFTYNGGLTRMEWNGSIPASGTVTLTYQVQVGSGAACSNITNQGLLHMDPNADGANSINEVSDDPGVNDGIDTDGDNATGDDDATIIAAACADLDLTKIVDNPTPILGDTITYTVTVVNLGPNNATGVIFSDTLSAATSYVSATPSQGICSGTVAIVCNLGSITNGASANIVVSVQTVAVGTATNAASVVANEFDPVFTNNTSAVSVVIGSPDLPATGFAPGQITSVPRQPSDVAYSNLGSFWLEIEKMDKQMPIIGVPFDAVGWDVTWLGDQAGYLEGSAYPTWPGNTLLSAHSFLADGTPGPFSELDRLGWGDEVVVHAFGMRYVYRVRQIMLVKPDDPSIWQHEEYDWITLITCRAFDESTGSYRWRYVVRAVLVSVETEQ